MTRATINLNPTGYLTKASNGVFEFHANSLLMLRIIIADDHEIVRQSVKQVLLDEFSPVHIEEAADTPSLIEKVMNNSWDLVISDLVMPGGGAFEALKNIKKERKDLPIIIISTYPADQYKNRVLKAGANDFISKDTFPSHLLQSVKRVLALD